MPATEPKLGQTGRRCLRTGTREAQLQRACAGAGAGEAAPSPGLVTYKTSPLEIIFDKAITQKKRIRSLRRSVWAAGHLHGLADHGRRAPVAWMVTLTYVGVDDWRPDHISAATEKFRRFCARKRVPCRYLWVAELQKRGAVHYHLITWLPEGVSMPHWDRATTTHSGRHVNALWPHGMTNVEKARNGVGYLMKYLSKIGDVAAFPHHLRLYGVGGLTPQARMVRGWYNLPEWAKREYGVGDLKRLRSHLVVIETGEVIEPMYRRQFIPGGILLHPLRDMPDRFHDGAYSRFPAHDLA